MLNKNLIPATVFDFVTEFKTTHPTIEGVKAWWDEMVTVVKDFPFPDSEMREHFMIKRYQPMEAAINKLSADSKTPLGDIVALGPAMETFIGDLLRDHFEFYDSKDYHDRLDEEFAKHQILTPKEIDDAYDDIMKRISAPEVATDGLMQYFLNHSSTRLANLRRAAKEDVSASRERLNRYARAIISMRRTLDTDRETLKARYNALQERRNLFTSPSDEEQFRQTGLAMTLNKIRLLPELYMEAQRLEHPNLSQDELNQRHNQSAFSPKILAEMRSVLLSEASTEEEKNEVHRKIYGRFDNETKRLSFLRERPLQEERDTEARRLFNMSRENIRRMNDIIRERLSKVENREVYAYLKRLAGNVDHMSRKQTIGLRNSEFEWKLIEAFIISTNFLLSFSDEEILAQLKKTQSISK